MHSAVHAAISIRHLPRPRSHLSINQRVARSLARRVNSSIPDSIMVMTLEEFAASVKGAVYAPGSSGYEERRSKAAHYQRLIGNRTPALWVVIREAPGDIQLTLKYATEHGLACTVLAGGHSRFSVCDGRVVIDLSELKHHELDLERRRIRVAAGMSLAEVVDATAPHHFQAPLGVVSHTGLGLVLGGGIGWLSRLHGVSADSLVGLKAVAGNGELIALSRDDLVTAAEQSGSPASAIEPDQLFRAFKGAPGSFAVVYEMELQCYEVPEQPTVVMNAFQLTMRSTAARTCVAFETFWRATTLRPNVVVRCTWCSPTMTESASLVSCRSSSARSTRPRASTHRSSSCRTRRQ